jgi:hypothetical protein
MFGIDDHPRRTDSRFQRCWFLDSINPGAMPQAHGEPRLWRQTTPASGRKLASLLNEFQGGDYPLLPGYGGTSRSLLQQMHFMGEAVASDDPSALTKTSVSVSAWELK